MAPLRDKAVSLTPLHRQLFQLFSYDSSNVASAHISSSNSTFVPRVYVRVSAKIGKGLEATGIREPRRGKCTRRGKDRTATVLLKEAGGGGEIRRIYTTLRIVSQSKNDRGRNQKKEVGTGIKGYGKREDWTPNFPLKDYVHLIFVATSTKTYQTLTIFFQTQILSGMIRL